MSISSNGIETKNIGINALEEKKGEHIKVIDVSEISSVCDIIVIASGNNINQLHAMADELEEQLGKNGYHFMSYEGYEKANWVLLDYNDVVFHLFDKESRNFYDLERLYIDGKYL